MVKDYTVLDGMITNQAAVLKAAYDRGYSHGEADGKDSMASVVAKEIRDNYDEGFNKGYEAGSAAVMEHVVKKILSRRNIKTPNTEQRATKDVIEGALNYIERLIKSGTGKKKSLEYLRKFIESESED